MKKSRDSSGTSIGNEGDNHNQMENLEVEGDIEQKNEIHQHYNDTNSGTVIHDPNAQNFWIDVCEVIADLPISESKILGTFFGLGGLGLLATLATTSPWNGFSLEASQYSLFIGLLFVSSIFLGFAIGYMNTDKDSRCPECKQRFAVRTEEVRKTDRRIRENGQDVIHGKRARKCRNCGFEEVQPDTWTPNEFDNLKSV